MVKNPPAMRETWVRPLVGKIPWVGKRWAWQPTPVFLPGEPPWTESLAGYSPWGHKELDMTERLSIYVRICHIFFIHSSVEQHKVCFLVLAIVNSAAMNTGMHVSLPISGPWFSPDTCRGVGLLGHMVALFKVVFFFFWPASCHFQSFTSSAFVLACSPNCQCMAKTTMLL